MSPIVPLAALVVATLAFSRIERRHEQRLWTVIGLCGLSSALLIPLGDVERATMLALMIGTAITGVSWTKHYHSGLKLAAADCPLIFAGTLRFMVHQYRGAALLLAIGLVALLTAAMMILLHPGATAIPPLHRAIVFAGALAALGIARRHQRTCYRTTITERFGYFSTFVMSLVDVPTWWPRRGLAMIDVAPEALQLRSATPARSGCRPDIIVIQHESLFDPRLYGLPLQPRIEAFFNPPTHVSGSLDVEIYGGGSWQSEFSFLTGLPSASFGPDAYFIQQRARDRIHHTLPRSLSALGYETTLIASCRRNFLGYDAFYRSIGFANRLFSDDLDPPFDIDAFERTHSDHIFLQAASRALTTTAAQSNKPHLTYILTNFNHGPHNRTMANSDSNEARQFALSTCADVQYAEYYARLSETVASWEQMRKSLTSRLARRPTIIVHYGDHQPVMTRRIERALSLPSDPVRHLRTFYAIETLNFSCHRDTIPPRVPLELSFLSTATLQLAGLPLDAVSATRAELFGPKGPHWNDKVQQLKGRFHRTLIENQLIDVA